MFKVIFYLLMVNINKKYYIYIYKRDLIHVFRNIQKISKLKIKIDTFFVYLKKKNHFELVNITYYTITNLIRLTR